MPKNGIKPIETHYLCIGRLYKIRPFNYTNFCIILRHTYNDTKTHIRNYYLCY